MKWLVGAVMVAVLLLVALVIAVPFLIDSARVQALISAQATQMLGRPVSFASVSASLWPAPAVRLAQLEVGEDPAFGPTPFLRVESGRITLRLLPLLSGRLEFGELILERPVIQLVKAANDRLNVTSLSRGGPAGRPSGRPEGRGAVAGGPAMKAAAVLGAGLRVREGRLVYTARLPKGLETPWHLEALEFRVDSHGEALDFNGSGQLMPGALALRILDGRLALTGRSLLEAPVAARVLLESEDIGGLLAAQVGPEPAVKGGVRGTLAITGTLGSPRAAGELASTSLRVTQTRAVCSEPKRRTLVLDDVRIAAGWQGDLVTARPLTTRLDRGTIRATVTVRRERGVHVQLADLAIRTLPLERVLVDFLCHGYAVAAPLDLTGAFTFSGRDPRGTLAGSGRVNVGAGRIVGAQAVRTVEQVARIGGSITSLLGADVPGPTVASPLEFDSITGTFTIAQGVLTTRDMLYSSSAMKLAIAGDYALTTERLNITVVASHGRGETKAMVTGTTAAPSIRIVSSTLPRGLEPKTIEGGLQELLRRFRR